MKNTLFITVVIIFISALTHAAQISIQDPGSGYDYCLQVRDNEPQRGSVVELWRCDEEGDEYRQKWGISNIGEFYTYGKYEDMYLDVPQSHAAPKELLQVWRRNKSAAQKFAITKGEIRSFGGSDLCLDVPHSNYQNGIQVQIYPCNGGSNQEWFIR